MSTRPNTPIIFNRERAARQLNARFDELLEKLRRSRPGEDPWLVRRAYEIAAERHRSQVRQSGDLYISHPVEVAHILADICLDAPTLAAALLHDVVEDTELPLEKIRERFGEDTARLVEGVTKISRLDLMAPEARQAENLRKMILAMVNDVRVVLIKLADRLHNMRTLEYVDPEKKRFTARKPPAFPAPFPPPPGMTFFRKELKALSSRYLDRNFFSPLKRELPKKPPAYEKFLEEVKAAIREKLVSNSIPAA